MAAEWLQAAWCGPAARHQHSLACRGPVAQTGLLPAIVTASAPAGGSVRIRSRVRAGALCRTCRPMAFCRFGESIMQPLDPAEADGSQSLVCVVVTAEAQPC